MVLEGLRVLLFRFLRPGVCRVAEHGLHDKSRRAIQFERFWELNRIQMGPTANMAQRQPNACTDMIVRDLRSGVEAEVLHLKRYILALYFSSQPACVLLLVLP